MKEKEFKKKKQYFETIYKELLDYKFNQMDLKNELKEKIGTDCYMLINNYGKFFKKR